MKKRLLLVSLLLCVLWAGSFLPAFAQGGKITVLSTSVESKFAEGVVFKLSAQSDSNITKITLFYKIKTPLPTEQVTNRGYPKFTPALKVDVEHTWKLERGQLPPQSEIEYFWRIEDAAGGKLDSPKATYTYIDDRFQWQTLTKSNITLYWYEGDQAYAQKLLDRAVEALAFLQKDVGVELKQPVKIVVYQSKEDMQLALIRKGETWEGGIITLGTVIPDSGIMLLLGTHDEVMETIPHELTHMVVEQATWNPYGGIPTWLNEGLASYAELNGEPPPGRQEDLEQAIKDDRLLSIRSLSAEPGDPDQVNLFYAESFSLVKFLLDQYGKDKMSQFLATFKEGSLPEDALKKVYGFGIDELEAKWRESLGLKPRMAITVTAVPKATTPAISATPTVVPPTPTKVPSGGLCSGAVVGLLAIGYVIWRRQPLARG